MGRYGWTKAHFDNFNWRLENPDSNKFIDIVVSLFDNENYKMKLQPILKQNMKDLI